jgi:CRISPR-associated protein Csh1
VSGGFKQKDAWKNYPVCFTCSLQLEAGKKYVRRHLSYNFYGFKYHLIPKFLTITNYETMNNLFELIIEEWKDPKFQKREMNRLTEDEQEILEVMSKQSNSITFNFMFYETPKGYDGSIFNILLNIEDVLPSSLRILFDLKKEVDEITIFRECMTPIFENNKKIGEKPLEFNFGALRTFFPSRSYEGGAYDKYFLEITNKIFTARPVDYDFIMRVMMQRIRDDFAQPNNWFGSTNEKLKISSSKGLMLLVYLNKLGILQTGRSSEVIKMKGKNLDISEEGLCKKVNEFLDEFSDFFDHDAKKAIFLEGVLTQYLLEIQYVERKGTPFRVKLKGLKLDEKQIKKLLPEIQNKLEEYGKNYYRELESIISQYFVSAGSGWKLTNDEISFYFVQGMNLSKLFKKEKQENMEVTENE